MFSHTCLLLKQCVCVTNPGKNIGSYFFPKFKEINDILLKDNETYFRTIKIVCTGTLLFSLKLCTISLCILITVIQKKLISITVIKKNHVLLYYKK